MLYNFIKKHKKCVHLHQFGSIIRKELNQSRIPKIKRSYLKLNMMYELKVELPTHTFELNIMILNEDRDRLSNRMYYKHVGYDGHNIYVRDQKEIGNKIDNLFQNTFIGDDGKKYKGIKRKKEK